MTVLKIIAAFLVGAVAGSIVNMGLILLGPHLIPVPEGVNVNDPESLKASMHLFEFRHFVFPFLAHAAGTFVGALVAYLLAPLGKRREMAWGIGILFFCGGIAASFMIPAPGWFIAVDLALAYLPMAWLADKLGDSITGKAKQGDNVFG